jgi:hypothetical protein
MRDFPHICTVRNPPPDVSDGGFVRHKGESYAAG